MSCLQANKQLVKALMRQVHAEDKDELQLHEFRTLMAQSVGSQHLPDGQSMQMMSNAVPFEEVQPSTMLAKQDMMQRLMYVDWSKGCSTQARESYAMYFDVPTTTEATLLVKNAARSNHNP